MYINASNKNNPKDILGCGTWKEINPNYYLMSVKSARDNSDYNAYNNSYGNYAGSYLNECLPNITGTFSFLLNGAAGSRMSATDLDGAFYCYTGTATTRDGYSNSYNTNGYCMGAFSAARLYSGKKYRNNCNAVRVQSYGVYIWQRTS